MLQLDKRVKTPYYVQIYTYYRQQIESRSLPAGTRLASVRELAQELGVSKMTVEKAYYQLAGEGYILRRSKARYEVASVRVPRKADRPRSALEEAAQSPAAIAYDFGSGDLAAEAFPLAVWRKLMNRVLHEPDLLLANQDEQGAPVLRHVLSQYIYIRPAVSRPDRRT